MQKCNMYDWSKSSFLFNSQSYVEQLYEDYLKNPNFISSDWKNFFKILSNINSNKKENFQSKEKKCSQFLEINSKKNISSENEKYLLLTLTKNKIKKLINSYRTNGHKNSNLDPLNLYKNKILSELDIFYHKLKEKDLDMEFSCFIEKKLKLKKIHKILKKIYCASIGIEYMHISDIKQKKWIQKKIEFKEEISELFEKKEKINFLTRLIEAEGLEKYIGLKFPGTKRFSLEGCEVLIPVLKEIIYYSSNFEIEEIILGMAHRGRLNVLINIFGKNPKDLFDEFSGKFKKYIGSGDVKYHQGYSCDYKINKKIIHLWMSSNPSHLEIISPVIAGSAKAKIDQKNKNTILPITIHGDAAVIAQGVVQETLNLSQVPGYSVNGTIRIIINNQIGFTTSNPKYARTTKYCTDIMKMIEAPIFHVNSDDVESAIFVAKLALEFRNKFKKDVVIDLVCYRRQGHNEADEPRATQPIMYKKIKKHSTVCTIYSKNLTSKNILNFDQIKQKINNYRNKLDLGYCIPNECIKIEKKYSLWKTHLNRNWQEEYFNQYTEKKLKKLAKSINTIPKEIVMQERVNKIYDDRLKMAENQKLLDWGFAETLSYATLLDQGINIRLSGEDTSRGTFFHRHAIIHNQTNNLKYIPLKNIHEKQGNFNILDSVLSEEATLAFEYGYASTDPKTLNIWEAQFGDFANVAQVVIDQFITSSEQKWGVLCGLIMLLPHGYEGQGPEHSSARLERYLQLCAEKNIQICTPTTPAQIYHLIRRQILRKMRKPLIIMSPKSLLRHPLATSNFEELANKNFFPIIDEKKLTEKTKIKRIVLCCGKIYYDLIEERTKNNQNNIAIIRIEQLYPFPNKILKKILESYTNVQEFIWCQEEPYNQGSWFYSKEKLKNILPKNSFLSYLGRPKASSPAVGYFNIHQKQQKKIIQNAIKIIK